MNYTLRFNGIDIATITETDANFPSFYGRYELLKTIDRTALPKALFEYIDVNIRTWPLIQADRLDQVDHAEEARYTDLIESDKWSLLTEAEESVPILVPLFTSDQGVIWRLR